MTEVTYSSKTWKHRFWKNIVGRRPDGLRCIFCNCAYVEIEGHQRSRSIEHIVPKSHGGTNGFRNLAGSCVRCNNRRGDTDFVEWGIAVKLLQDHNSPNMSASRLIAKGQTMYRRDSSLQYQFSEIYITVTKRFNKAVDEMLAAL